MSNQDIKVTGVAGGTVERPNAAGIVHDGMGHNVTTTHNQGSRSIKNKGNIGNIATGDNHSGAMSASVGGPTRGTRGPDIELMTVEDVQNLMIRERFPESVRKKIEENGIDGKYFVNLLEDGVLDALGITSPLDKMKIKTILEKSSK
ncbi:uncharacterized protein LOC124267648 [Haliotis rubra]|uniref:uncharacterized protein LOC124267648 n=1 Tax=Haliotis rubra TaxID=36100 RepID=UPI001EE5685C|nr:uncharacterized protein LOC124267648 [Haliotis rubra]